MIYKKWFENHRCISCQSSNSRNFKKTESEHKSSFLTAINSTENGSQIAALDKILLENHKFGQTAHSDSTLSRLKNTRLRT